MSQPYRNFRDLMSFKRNFKRYAKGFIRDFLILIRKLDMTITMRLAIWSHPWSQKTRIFNLDLHTSLIADINAGLKDFDVKLVSWSLSGNNRNFRRFYKIPDPVEGISGKNWLTLRPEDLNSFAQRYEKYLRTFDGFIVCFPPAFAQVFTKFDKPILIFYGTRYEAPFTHSDKLWGDLNEVLKAGIKSSRITIVANNMGDVDYFKYFSGFTPKYIPSLCDYTKAQWQNASNLKIVFARDERISHQVSKELDSTWLTPTEAFGKRYSWRKLSQVSEILVIPYNISTMTLFELATAGIPVSIPSQTFIDELMHEFDGVLSELSFFNVLGMDTKQLALDNPNRTDQTPMLNWWKNRADFYNSELMPNVRLIDRFEDLRQPHPFLTSSTIDCQADIQKRNAKIYKERRELLKNFIIQVQENSRR